MLNYKNKRGQFYLIVAVIVVVAVGGIVLMENYVQTSKKNTLYEVGEELRFESEKVIDYGVYKTVSETSISDLLTEFTELYTRYRGNERDLYFVFGNQDNLTVAGYVGSESETQEDEEALSIIKVKSLKGNEEFPSFEIEHDGVYAYKDYDLGGLEGNDIAVVVEDIDYHFNLGSGEYLYFVIMQKIDGEYYIVTE